MSIRNTRTIYVESLDGSEGYALVGDRGGIASITGEVSNSSVMPGCKAVETEHGTLYLDNDLEIEVVDAWPVPQQVNEAALVAEARSLMEGAGGSSTENSEYLRGMTELIAVLVCAQDEDLDGVRERVLAAIRPA